MGSEATNITVLPVQSQMTRASIQPLLPTCLRCRRLRRKCDTQLPNCRLCEKAGEECLFVDHALKQPLPRAYVEALLVRLDQLQAVRNRIQDPSLRETLPRLQTPRMFPVPIDGQPENAQSVKTTSFDLIIPSGSTPCKSGYWGSSSVFALAAEIIYHAHIKRLISAEDARIYSGDEDVQNIGLGRREGTNASDNGTFRRQMAPAEPRDIESLISHYMKSVNSLYGIVDEGTVSEDIAVYLSSRNQSGSSPYQLSGRDAHGFFRIAMMCAITCANQARYRPFRAAESRVYYAEAVACVESVTSEASSRSLQALLLLIIFCLFHPKSGDIWKMLDYACRLAVELGYHTEQDWPEVERAAESEPNISESGPNPGGRPDAEETQESRSRRKLRRSTFWGLYAIERIVGQLLGRGTDLPESIIQVEYPSASSPDETASEGLGYPALQPMSISHHYRLVYLRSEIFRALYLPAKPPALGLSWMKERFLESLAWRHELDSKSADSDAARLDSLVKTTCDFGYGATICFLFQPLMLRALRRTSSTNDNTPDQDGEDDTAGVVPRENFQAACNLIRIYEKVIRAPETSTLGTYPVTFMSAHYIWLASSTLLAHALLALDGRTRVLLPFSENEASPAVDVEGVGGNVDLGAFVEISGSCLMLLSWCVERWPGMGGMMDVQKKLFARVTRELIRKDLVR